MGKLPVLFLPGTLCTPAVFDLQIKALALYAPYVEVVEFRFEDSVSEMASKAIERMDHYGEVAIIGFSMGGMVAMEIARKTPQLIGKLALLNSTCHADRADWQAARILHLQQARTLGMEHVIRQYYLDHYLFQPLASARNLITTMACELGTGSFEAQIKALASRPDSSTTLEGLRCPALILGSREDEMCGPRTQTQMSQLITGSELVMLDDCGHFSMLEKPVEVNRALTHWYLQS